MMNVHNLPPTCGELLSPRQASGARAYAHKLFASRRAAGRGDPHSLGDGRFHDGGDAEQAVEERRTSAWQAGGAVGCTIGGDRGSHTALESGDDGEAKGQASRGSWRGTAAGSRRPAATHAGCCSEHSQASAAPWQACCPGGRAPASPARQARSHHPFSAHTAHTANRSRHPFSAHTAHTAHGRCGSTATAATRRARGRHAAATPFGQTGTTATPSHLAE